MEETIRSKGETRETFRDRGRLEKNRILEGRSRRGRGECPRSINRKPVRHSCRFVGNKSIDVPGAPWLFALDSPETKINAFRPFSRMKRPLFQPLSFFVAPTFFNHFLSSLSRLALSIPAFNIDDCCASLSIAILPMAFRYIQLMHRMHSNIVQLWIKRFIWN